MMYKSQLLNLSKKITLMTGFVVQGHFYIYNLLWLLAHTQFSTAHFMQMLICCKQNAALRERKNKTVFNQKVLENPINNKKKR